MDKVKEDVLEEVDPGGGERGLRRSRSRGLRGRRNHGQKPAVDHRLVHGQTQHTIGNAMVRASCILQLALGNIGVSGGGTNIFRGHDNVQGATDVGPEPGFAARLLRPGRRLLEALVPVWNVDYDWIKAQFRLPGDDGKTRHDRLALDRRRDGEERARSTRTQSAGDVYWGHAPNSQTRGLDMKPAMEKLDLMVIIDPYPTATAVMPDRQEGVYLLPAATQFETVGGRARRPIARSSGARRLSSRCSSPSPITPSCTCSPRNSASATEFVQGQWREEQRAGR